MSETTMQQTGYQRPDRAEPVGSSAPAAAIPLITAAEALSDLRPAPPPFMARRRHDLLTRTIAEEIVPRLVLAQRTDPAAALAKPALNQPLHGAIEADVAELTAMVLQSQFSTASALIERISSHQPGVEAIYLDLLAPVARRLGAMWEDDLCDFVEVTIGLMRLQQILTTLSTPLAQEGSRSKPRILLVPGPGDQHSFGLSMVASFFQRAGWHGWSGIPGSTADLLARVQAESFGVVGFSVSNDTRLDALRSTIRAVRRASRNREVGIMVGGPIFTAHPEMAAMVGADTTAIDGRQAVLQAQRMLTLIPSRG